MEDPDADGVDAVIDIGDGQTGRDLHRGRQRRGGKSGRTAVVTVEEVAGKRAQQGFHADKQEVENAVKHGAGKDLPHADHAQNAKGVEKQHQQHAEQQSHADGVAVEHAEGGGDERGECKADEQRHDLAEKPGEIVREEQPLAADRHGVHAVCGARIRQVGEHRHGEENAENSRHHHAGGKTGVQKLIGEGRARIDNVSVAQADEEGDRQKEQPDERICRPQRPGALQCAAQQLPVKVRCHGPHSLHLPVHR